jgi:hypothetical protein
LAKENQKISHFFLGRRGIRLLHPLPRERVREFRILLSSHPSAICADPIFIFLERDVAKLTTPIL